MFTRVLRVPPRSFFLFGPRGTGKTTWLRANLRGARWYDLVRDREVFGLIREPRRFTQEVEALPKGTWVVIDEVQRLPALLNDVQDLISRHGSRWRFALTGSSARKLKRGEVNLLAARVINRKFFPLTAPELGFDFQIDDLLRFGCLPSVRGERSDKRRVDLLEAYVENYLVQEIRMEAVVKQLAPFTRFLEVAAIANGEVVNVSGIARDAAVARPTVQGYFEVLVDTLIGTWLPAWRPRAKIKEAAHAKFYFFDSGVVRGLTGHLRDPIDSVERGKLLETYLLHELRAFVNVAGCGGQLGHWRTPSGSEVDFIWSRGAAITAIEVKIATEWRSSYGAALRSLASEKVLTRAFGVYLGERALRDGPIDVLPLRMFLQRLSDGKIIG